MELGALTKKLETEVALLKFQQTPSSARYPVRPPSSGTTQQAALSVSSAHGPAPADPTCPHPSSWAPEFSTASDSRLWHLTLRSVPPPSPSSSTASCPPMRR